MGRRPVTKRAMTNLSCYLASLMVTVLAGADESEPLRIHVSTRGDDRGRGTLIDPVRSLERAARPGASSSRSHPRGRSRASRRSLSPREGARARSRGILVRRAPTSFGDPTPASTRSCLVGVALHLEWAREGALYRAAVSEELAKAVVFDGLYVDGVRLPMARFPNVDPAAKFSEEPRARRSRRSAWRAGRILRQDLLHALHQAMWGSKHYAITGVNGRQVELRGGWQENRGGGFDPIFRGGYHRDHLFVENIRENSMHLASGSSMRSNGSSGFSADGCPISGRAEVIAAGATELFVAAGSVERPVRGVRIEGLTFRHTKRVFMEPTSVSCVATGRSRASQLFASPVRRTVRS